MGRNALKWAFSVGSFWNQPRSTTATLVPVGRAVAAITAQGLPLRGVTFIGKSGATYTYTGGKCPDGRTAPTAMDPTQPLQSIWRNGGQTAQRQYASAPPTVLHANIPMNPNFIVPSSGSNSTASFVGADGSTLFNYAQTCHATVGTYTGSTPATSGTATPGLLTAGHGAQYGTIFGDGQGGSEAGSGLSSLGGVVRAGELVTAYNGGTPIAIPHALRIDMNGHSDMSSAGTGYRWPATMADGKYATPGDHNFYDGFFPQCVEGSQLTLPIVGGLPSIWSSLQTNAGKVFALTMAIYGFYPCNDATNSRWTIPFEYNQSITTDTDGIPIEFLNTFGHSFVQNVNGSGVGTTSPGSVVSHAFAADWQLMITNAYVNNTVASNNIPGGPSPYYAPLAPAFGPPVPFLQQVQAANLTPGTSLTVPNALTSVGGTCVLLVGAKGAGTVLTPAEAGASWGTNEVGIGNATIVLSRGATNVTNGNYVTIKITNRVASVGSIASVAKTAGTATVGSFTFQGGITDAALDLRIEYWSVPVTGTGTITITATFAGTGAGNMICSEWSNIAGSLDGALVTATGTTSPITLSGSSAVGAGDLVEVAYAQVGTPVFSAQAFTPAGTSFNVPDLKEQSTGADNHALECAQTLSASGTQSYSATNSAGRWVAVLAAWSPASSGGGSIPTISVSGGGGWTRRLISSFSTASFGVLTGWELTPASPISASGITISSTVSGSIECEFYEMLDVTYQSSIVVFTPTAGTAPTESITPSEATNVQVGAVMIPAAGISMTPTSVASWSNDSTITGAGSGGAASSLVSGANVPNSSAAQTYSATLGVGSPWAVALMDYSLGTVPGQPGAPVASAGAAKASLTWVTPSNGGDPFSAGGVTVTPYIAGVAQAPITGIDPTVNYSLTPYVVTGLTNGTAYTFTVFYINPNGSGPPSPQSNAVTPSASTVPSTPSAPAVVIGDTTATSTITPPATGGSPLTSYTFNCYIGVTLQQTQTQLVAVGTSFTFTGLTDGQAYNFTCLASNGNGASAESGATAATPIGAPAQPNAPACTPGVGSMAVTVTPPANNGSAITSYTFNCYLGAVNVQTQTQAGVSFTFSGLVPGTQYGFTAIATNGVGSSSESSVALATPTGGTLTVGPTLMFGSQRNTPFSPL